MGWAARERFFWEMEVYSPEEAPAVGVLPALGWGRAHGSEQVRAGCGWVYLHTSCGLCCPSAWLVAHQRDLNVAEVPAPWPLPSLARTRTAEPPALGLAGAPLGVRVMGRKQL